MARTAVITTAPLHPYRPDTSCIYIAVQIFDPITGKQGASWEGRFNVAQALDVSPIIDGAQVMSLICVKTTNAYFHVQDHQDTVDGKSGMTAFLDFLRAQEVSEIWYDSNKDNVQSLKWMVQHYVHNPSLQWLLNSTKFYDYAMILKLEDTPNPSPEIWKRNEWAADVIHRALVGLSKAKAKQAPPKKTPPAPTPPEDDEL